MMYLESIKWIVYNVPCCRRFHILSIIGSYWRHIMVDHIFIPYHGLIINIMIWSSILQHITFPDFLLHFHQEFEGNKNINDIEKNVLEPSIIAKRIRIFPTGYQSNPVQHMCLRAELYGCTRDLGKPKASCYISVEKPFVCSRSHHSHFTTYTVNWE